MRTFIILLLTFTIAEAQEAPDPEPKADYGGFFEPENDAERERLADLQGQNIMRMHHALARYGSTAVRLIRDFRFTEVALKLSNDQVDQLNDLSNPDHASVGQQVSGKRGNPYAVPKKQFANYTKKVESQLKAEDEEVNKATGKTLDRKQLKRISQIGFQHECFGGGDIRAAFKWCDHKLSEDEIKLWNVEAVENSQLFIRYRAAFQAAIVYSKVKSVIGDETFEELSGKPFGFGMGGEMIETAMQSIKDHPPLNVSLLNGTVRNENLGSPMSYPALIAMRGVLDELELEERTKLKIRNLCQKHRDLWASAPRGISKPALEKQKRLMKEMDDVSRNAVALLTDQQRKRLDQIRFQQHMRLSRFTKTFEESGVKVDEKTVIGMIVDLADIQTLQKLHLAEFQKTLQSKSLVKLFGEEDVQEWIGDRFVFFRRVPRDSYADVNEPIPYVTEENSKTFIAITKPTEPKKARNPRRRRGG